MSTSYKPGTVTFGNGMLSSLVIVVLLPSPVRRHVPVVGGEVRSRRWQPPGFRPERWPVPRRPRSCYWVAGSCRPGRRLVAGDPGGDPAAVPGHPIRQQVPLGVGGEGVELVAAALAIHHLDRLPLDPVAAAAEAKTLILRFAAYRAASTSDDGPTDAVADMKAGRELATRTARRSPVPWGCSR